MANEKRLIDANFVKRAVKEVMAENSSVALFIMVAENICKMLDHAPTVDAVEVVHAYWTGSRFNPMTIEYEEYCSHCCAWSSEYGKPYCPNCGAKMDGGN